MNATQKFFTKKELTDHVVRLFEERGVTIRDIALITYDGQVKYVPTLTLEKCEESVLAVLSKREVQNAVMTGIELDKAAEEGRISDPYLASMLRNDDGLYGIDEVVQMSIVGIYGSVSWTNYGYFDKVKPGIIGELDNHGDDGKVHTYLDDIVGAVAAAACSRIAHRDRDEQLGEL